MRPVVASRLNAFVALVCGSGLVCLVAVLLATDVDALAERRSVVVALVVLVLVGELLPIIVPRDDAQDEITVSTTFVLALVMIGPLAVALVVQAIAVSLEDLRDRKEPAKVLFNAMQYVLVLCAVRAVFCLLTGQPFLSGSPVAVPDDLPAALLAGATFFVVNNTLVGVVTAFARNAPVMAQIGADVRFQLYTSGVLLAFAPIAAMAMHTSLWTTPMVLLPIMAIHKSARMAATREQEALHDSLTGLPNRFLFRTRVLRAIEEAERTGATFGVVMVDLDRFKEVNDTLGHQVGDDVLVKVASRISANLRPGDTVARLGGDEFALLTGDLTDVEDGLTVARRVLAALEDPFVADNVHLDVQASLGLAVYGEHGTDVDTLLSRADIAMYNAKEERGTVRVYEPTADDHNPERLALAAELRHGLQNGEVFLVFQPKIDATAGHVTGLEALVRWRHPKHGVLLPDEFLPVVENTGLILPLTMEVLDQALGALAQWRRSGNDVTVAVNLSVRHLADLALPGKVEEALRAHEVPAEALTLEVTETVLMTDPSRAVAVLGSLRALGVGVAIDDFGTGYSSLAYLRRLQVDELKIDKSFVLGMAGDEGSAVIVRSTIEMGHNLGLRVVAEGVEDEGTLAVLRRLHCDVVQGYGLCRPLAADQVTAWLATRRTTLLAVQEWWVSAASQPVVPAVRRVPDVQLPC